MSDISQKKLEAILKLDKDKRLKHFVKQVCNWDEVWALWDGDWVFSESSEGMEFFQVWPNEIYAKLYCVGEWEDCQSASIKLDGISPIRCFPVTSILAVRKSLYWTACLAMRRATIQPVGTSVTRRARRTRPPAGTAPRSS